MGIRFAPGMYVRPNLNWFSRATVVTLVLNVEGVPIG